MSNLRKYVSWPAEARRQVFSGTFFPFLFFFVVLPSSAYFFTVGVERFDFSLDHTQAHTTFGRTPQDEGSAGRRDLYLTAKMLSKTNIHAPRWDSNPRSQQALGHRPKP
jgi:hypothetical protein